MMLNARLRMQAGCSLAIPWAGRVTCNYKLR